MIRSTRLLDLSGLVLDKRNPSSMAIQLVHHNVAAGQSDKVNVFCQGCHDYVGEQECDVLRAKLTPQALLYSLYQAHPARAPCTVTHAPTHPHPRIRATHSHSHTTPAVRLSPRLHASSLPPHPPRCACC